MIMENLNGVRYIIGLIIDHDTTSLPILLSYQ